MTLAQVPISDKDRIVAHERGGDKICVSVADVVWIAKKLTDGITPELLVEDVIVPLYNWCVEQNGRITACLLEVHDGELFTAWLVDSRKDYDYEFADKASDFCLALGKKANVLLGCHLVTDLEGLAKSDTFLPVFPHANRE